MRVLITGGSSLLGKALIETAPPDMEIAATWYTNCVSGYPMYQLDVSNLSQISYVMEKVEPHMVIHCAVTTSVDYAETNYQESHQVTVRGSKNVQVAAELAGARFIYPSTNAVFSGEEPPYKENSLREPVNRYGSIRKQAEDAVMNGKDWLILRLFLMFGWPWPKARQNWATIALDKLRGGDGLRIVNDKWYQPAYCKDVARVIWALSVTVKGNDVYNVAPSEAMTLYSFVREVAKTFGLDADLVKPVASSEFPDIAPRPVDSTYDVSKLNDLGLKIAGAREGLLRMKEDKHV